MIGLTVPAFYPVLDTALLSRMQIAASDAAEAILDAGARILQLRRKGHFSRQAFDQARNAVAKLEHKDSKRIVGDFFQLDFTRNGGAAFGLAWVLPHAGLKLLTQPWWWPVYFGAVVVVARSVAVPVSQARGQPGPDAR